MHITYNMYYTIAIVTHTRRPLTGFLPQFTSFRKFKLSAVDWLCERRNFSALKPLYVSVLFRNLVWMILNAIPAMQELRNSPCTCTLYNKYKIRANVLWTDGSTYIIIKSKVLTSNSLRTFLKWTFRNSTITYRVWWGS